MDKSLINFLATLQSLLGGVGALGIILYLLEPETSHSRYQVLALPFGAVLLALPLIIVSLWAYRRHSSGLSTLERGVFFFSCFFPIATFCVAVAVSGNLADRPDAVRMRISEFGMRNYHGRS